ncbi:cytochrome P450 [Dendrothele bispora CBS 962.96]|uniref:Cytochrome P450 n=1 Tax=Dendrothele bispora (strain CBS 962.96) TaxID=1314807 RepID=A0A4V4HF11_DENBC|nr:cytochrome P450 [Dendrothele bispora CBS 962.96]
MSSGFLRVKTVGFEVRKIYMTRVKGEAEQSSICATLLKPGARQARHHLSDHELAWLAGSLFMAGYETSSNTLTWFMYLMILFPEIQTKAQEQVDQVVGRSRLPTFADAKHLPYIWAIIKEMLRWRPPAPIGMLHATLADDYYEGYFLPKNSIVIPNIWSINRDPEVYENRVEDFYPERHLSSEGKLKDTLDEGHFAFGFGHRSCVGRHVANNALFVDVVTILWAMKMKPVKDEHGKPIVPSIDEERSGGIILNPPKCQFTCTPRFEEVDMILQQARDDILKSTRYTQE